MNVRDRSVSNSQSSTSKPLRALLIEDSPDDADLLIRELQRGGYDVTSERVETPAAMTAALTQRTWDIVLADYTLPRFSGIAALKLLKASGLDLPFIIISGSIGEELAVAAMKAGAHDYLMKGNIARLIPSIERELRDVEIRRERRRAEEALQYSEARTRAIVNSALDSIITMDHMGNVVEFNPAAEKTFGYERGQVIGKPLADFIIPPALQQGHREGLKRYLATRDSALLGKWIAMTALRADGREFPVELAIACVSQEGVPLFTAYIRDLTEEKAQEETRRRSQELEEQNLRIQEANRLKSEFLANMSHELRTPLNAILGFSQIMIDQKAGPLNADQTEYLNDILTSGKHLLQLINDVLDLAKIEAGKIELDLRTFSLEKAVDEVCTVMKPAALKKHIRVNTQLPANLDWVTLDERKFKQILYNLLSNAVKFSDYERKVDVIVEPDGLGQIRLQVNDCGIGIKEEDLPRLFREFEQLDCGADRRYQGTGLGLALTKKLVEFQGGSITVESEFGSGSSFIVRLPSGMTNSVRNPQPCAENSLSLIR